MINCWVQEEISEPCVLKEAKLLLNSVEFGLIKACVIGFIIPPSLHDCIIRKKYI